MWKQSSSSKPTNALRQTLSYSIVSEPEEKKGKQKENRGIKIECWSSHLASNLLNERTSLGVLFSSKVEHESIGQ